MTEETIFAVALEKSSPAERTTYLDQACAGDAALRQRVEALLQSHFHGASFLETPAVQRPAEELKGQAYSGDTQGEPPDGGGVESLDFLAPSDKPDVLGRLGHYEVLEVVGKGGMGIVLRAFDEKLHRVVAIKVMAPPLAASATARKRFIREAQAAAAVRNDYVINIYAVEEGSEPPYLVMEYISGQSLQERLDQTGPLELTEMLRIGMQTALGLAAAHAQGLIHRDIKPANILLENGVERVKITDFGLARAAADASLTQSGVVAGTPHYMSPEQARGEAVDRRTDLFSLGSVLYAMGTGRAPFRASGSMAVLKRVCEETPRPIRETNPEIPDWLVAIIARLHAKDPAQRYPSAAEVAELLNGHLAQLQHPSVVGQVSNLPVDPKAGWKPAPRRRRWAVAAAVFALLLLGGLSLTEATGVTNLRTTVIRIFTPDGTLIVEVDDPGVKVTIEGDGGLVITGAGPQEVRLRPGNYRLQATKDGEEIKNELVTISRGDKQVVKVTMERRRTVGEIRRFVGHAAGVHAVAFSRDARKALSSGYDKVVIHWDIQTGRELRRIKHPGEKLSLAYSPKGHKALVNGNKGTLSLWDLETGEELHQLHQDAAGKPAFSPDGRYALCGTSENKLRLWDLETGKEVQCLEGHQGRIEEVVFTPEGRRALSGGKDKVLRLWDLETGKELRRFEGSKYEIWSVALSPDGRRAVSGGYDEAVRLWDLETGMQLRAFVHTGTGTCSVAFSPDGHRILTGTGEIDRTMRLWDVETGKELHRFHGFGQAVRSVAFSPDGRYALSGSWDGTVRLWQLPPPEKK